MCAHVYYCHATLAEIPKRGFSPRALMALSDGNPLPHQVCYTRAELLSAASDVSLPHGRLLIPGQQEKVGLNCVHGFLKPAALTKSRYLLKLAPHEGEGAFLEEMPANEHLTMQIAAQAFKVIVAPNACLELLDEERAYCVRRFDRQEGRPVHVEDFCQLSGRSPMTHGLNYRTNCSYEEMAGWLRNCCAHYRMEVARLFRRIVVNYCLSNGQAHLKDFSVIRTVSGDFVLAPAYDLQNTALHFSNTPLMAMPLFKDEAAVPPKGYTLSDFKRFGRVIGVEDYRIEEVFAMLKISHEKVSHLIDHSFLSTKAKKVYRHVVLQRCRKLLGKTL